MILFVNMVLIYWAFYGLYKYIEENNEYFKDIVDALQLCSNIVYDKIKKNIDSLKY